KHVTELFQNVSDAKLIGLSATPGRATFNAEENLAFANFFKKNKVTLEVDGYANPINYLQDQGYLAKVNFHDLPYKPESLSLTKDEIHKMSNEKDIPDSVIQKLGIDTKRNIKILNTVLSEYEKGSHIILFACSVKNAEALHVLLKYKNIACGLITSETPT